jgi:D-isomer specific 2-hydroxyacid dehydrogenase, NAD binding domain
MEIPWPLLHRHRPGCPAQRIARAGVPVFNARLSSIRSVAELVLGEIVAPSISLADYSADLRRGESTKSAAGSFAIRGKTFGIVGCGHVGSQISIIAEALGMVVVDHDVASVFPVGRATAADFFRLRVSPRPVQPGHCQHDGRAPARTHDEGRNAYQCVAR